MNSDASPSANIQSQPFGRTATGKPVDLFTLSNASGMRVEIMNYGATIVRWWVPDREGHLADVVLGYDDLAGYEAGKAYYGAVVGRFGNRIAGGRFSLDGHDYELPTNSESGEQSCHLHGGPEGLDSRVWQADAKVEDGDAVLRLATVSPDGHMGYPGTVLLKITYRLTADNALRVIYEGETDAPTILNLTQHSYFNLAGAGAGLVTDHILQLGASRFLPVNPAMIPTGEREMVVGTPFDFVAPKPLGFEINGEHEQIQRAGGYDHCLIFDEPGPAKRLVARVLERGSGRMLEVSTTEPGVQLYTGNFINEGELGKAGQTYGPRGGFCLETQHFPDSPNQPDFPSTVVRPGQPYHSETEFRFGLAQGVGRVGLRE